MLRLGICKCQKVGERASGGHIVKVLAPSFFFLLGVISFIMMVSIGLGFYFGGKSFSRLGSRAINMGLKAAEGSLGSFARVSNSEILRASYCPTSSQIQPTSSRKNENRYV